MKRLIIAVALMLLFSCSSDGNNDETTENLSPASTNLTGHWNLIAKTVNGQPQAISGCEEDYNWYEFGTDNGAIIGKFSMYQTGGNNYCRQITGQGAYSVTGDILTYTSGENGSITKYNIISANSLTIRLERFYSKTATGEATVPQAQRVVETCNKSQ
ncbi:hypothetical protein FNO01nite_09450 [Flavobacterium noncentrifugens]|uniref:Lipocalin-like domain-containing protein n=1 Tax=Flavobacterium noncentrifugens TaxID=1128970 RepID=A0A1G8UZ49_9FLAO|nr:lipocalin family protein [Flavobacterium noncentrifugens]GEP50273.1 hypothetical protein FNO01nite_09450 [Flavobacterium noncentrifugens]SDJ59091.1 Lipocalin-like domain-containing protein [Flavobacterium noncentrifugens]